MTINNWPLTERPREKLLTQGAKSLSHAELLAIFFRTGIRGKTALDLARELLSDFGNLKNVLNALPEQFFQKPGMGQTKFIMLKAAIELGRRYFEEELPKGQLLNNSTLTKRFLMNQLKSHPHEVFACVFLDNQNRMICFEELFQGTLTEANVYPREVVKRALAHNAGKIILAHNHPSGNPHPSQADIDLTQSLKQALTLIDVQVIDHVVVGGTQTISLAEIGVL